MTICLLSTLLVGVWPQNECNRVRRHISKNLSVSSQLLDIIPPPPQEVPRRSAWQSNIIVPRLAGCWFRPTGPKSASSKAAGAYVLLNFWPGQERFNQFYLSSQLLFHLLHNHMKCLPPHQIFLQHHCLQQTDMNPGNYIVSVFWKTITFQT